MKTLWLFVVPFCVALPALAATGPAPAAGERTPLMNPFSAEDCAEIACRPEGKTFSVKASDGDITVNIPRSPYVTRDGTVVIYPGETVTIEFPDAGVTMGLPKFSTAEGEAADNKFTLTYELKTEGNKQTTYLYLRNNLGKIVKLDALMSRPSADGLKINYTTSCPVKPTARNTEFWDGPYFAIFLRNFRFMDDNAFLDCEAAEGK